jgi:hypothetical protein
MWLMSSSALVNGVSVDLSYVVAGIDADGEPAWLGPVVMVQNGSVYIDAWLGAGLSETELPDIDDATLAAIVEHIESELAERDHDGEYREPMTREQVRAEYVAVDVAAEMEDERAIAELLQAA